MHSCLVDRTTTLYAATVAAVGQSVPANIANYQLVPAVIINRHRPRSWYAIS